MTGRCLYLGFGRGLSRGGSSEALHIPAPEVYIMWDPLGVPIVVLQRFEENPVVPPTARSRHVTIRR